MYQKPSPRRSDIIIVKKPVEAIAVWAKHAQQSRAIAS
jgi:hypothetical protein